VNSIVAFRPWHIRCFARRLAATDRDGNWGTKTGTRPVFRGGNWRRKLGRDQYSVSDKLIASKFPSHVQVSVPVSDKLIASQFPSPVCNRFHRLSQKTGKRMFCYAARHGFATRKLIQGKGALTISQLMGHADGSTLARVYGHLDKNVDFLKKALVD
jgi:integrase